MKRIYARAWILAILVFLEPLAVHAQDALSQLRAKVNHIVVIYQENWSFDSLYGHFPGANGTANASTVSLTQVDKSGAPLNAAPLPLNGKDVDPNFASLSPSVLLRPFDLSSYIRPAAQTGDIVHRFYTQQLQIDGGRMDKFIAWSDNGGLVFFQAAFGGTFLSTKYTPGQACLPEDWYRRSSSSGRDARAVSRLLTAAQKGERRA